MQPCADRALQCIARQSCLSRVHVGLVKVKCSNVSIEVDGCSQHLTVCLGMNARRAGQLSAERSYLLLGNNVTKSKQGCHTGIDTFLRWCIRLVRKNCRERITVWRLGQTDNDGRSRHHVNVANKPLHRAKQSRARHPRIAKCIKVAWFSVPAGFEADRIIARCFSA